MQSLQVHRKRLRRREVPGPRFITFSAQRRLPVLTGPVAPILAAAIARVRRLHGLSLFARVIMPEHVHLLVMPSGIPLDRSLLSIKMAVSKIVIPKWRELGLPDGIRLEDGVRLWQKGGGFDRNVRDQGEFCREVTYIHRNPVERGLVEKAEDWRWSSVRWWMGQRDGELECDPPPYTRTDWAGWKGFV